MGAINGIAINTAHELSHKHDRIDHILSHLALVPTGYNHFRIEHPYGHHKRAATPEDPHLHVWVKHSMNFGHVLLSVLLNQQLKLRKIV